MQLISQGVIPVAKLIWRPGHGGFAFTVVCKATFQLQPTLSPLANQQEPVFEADEWTDTGSLLRSTDLVPFKKRPEVLIGGDAFAPEGRPVSSLVTRLVVGEIDKSIQVVGDRYVSTDGRFGETAPFVRMPLVWERAVGGQNTSNPVGKPFGTTGRHASSEWMLAPNLYPPGFDVPRAGSSVASVGYAPISPLWPSRFGCLKQHGANWDPLRWYERPLPSDIDLAYMNAAPADQQRTSPFADEVIYLENLHPVFARLSTRLQVVTPSATVDQGGGPEPLKLRCDTLVIDTNRALVMLVWRGHVVMDHPDRPGRVVITGPESTGQANFSEESDETAILVPTRHLPTVVLPFAKSTPPAVAAAPSPAPYSPSVTKEPVNLSNDDGETMVPGHYAQVAPAVVLPFAKSATPPAFPAPSPPSVAREPADHSHDEGETMIPIPGVHAYAAPVLPFGGAPREQAPSHAELPRYQPSIGQSLTEAPVPVGVGSWTPLAPDKPVTTTAVASVPLPEPSSPEPDAMETRLRTIQRAIWKGDRPIQQILAEHGLTELEWRAAKRASARKSNV